MDPNDTLTEDTHHHQHQQQLEASQAMGRAEVGQGQQGESAQDGDLEPRESEFSDGDEDQQDLMNDQQGDMASSDSQLQVKDPSQEMNQGQEEIDKDNEDPMKDYYIKENIILQWLAQNPGQKWVDKDFPTTSSQFYEDPANLPPWGYVFKNLEWRRPEEILKDPKFFIMSEDKNGKNIDIDAKHGLFGASWFLGALTIAGTRAQIIERLVVQKQNFDRGFVSFQFFKNGRWVQVIVDTLLPYEKEQNSRTCLQSSCNNPQQFWIQLMEKAYVKLHSNYERICKGNVLQGLVDLTGGVAEAVELQTKIQQKVIQKDIGQLWTILYSFYHQKFLLGCINTREDRAIKDAEQGQQGILQNHHYSIIDMRDFTKDGLRLVRLRNPWGNEGVWTGPFCEEADDWEKYKAVKEELKNVVKTKKSDGSWWMSFPDFVSQFERVIVGKIFPENWETYSIQSEWAGKTNGGRSLHPNEKAFDKTFEQGNQKYRLEEHTQLQSDDRWFNNPQFRVKVTKNTKVYISLMQDDQKITGQPYVPCGFMVAATKSKTQRFWERPPEADIVAEVQGTDGKREVTHFLTLKKLEKGPGVYLIIPNSNELKQAHKKDEKRPFYLRLFTSETITVSELPETQELSVQGQWTESSAGGSRRLQVKEDSKGKKKGDIKDNPSWCKNPQYFVSITQPTLVKVILRKGGAKKFKGWKIGMTVCRYEQAEEKRLEKQPKREKGNAGHNLQRLIQQTNQFLQPPVLKDVERKLTILPHEKFKESLYVSEQCSALFFKWNPTEGPFIIVPSSDGEDRYFGYKLTFYTNNPIELIKLDDSKNKAIIGRWEKDISAGGCHLSELNREVSKRTWLMNPKYHLSFKEEFCSEDEPIYLKITLTIAEKNWKKMNPNTVNGMIGIYLLEKREGKLTYSQDLVVSQTSFLPVRTIEMQLNLGTTRLFNKNGYLIMPSTYEAKVQGSFILSVKCDRTFELLPSK